MAFSEENFFANFEASRPRKRNSQIMEIFNYLNIKPVMIKMKIYSLENTTIFVLSTLTFIFQMSQYK
jgi:hypothetical protein